MPPLSNVPVPLLLKVTVPVGGLATFAMSTTCVSATVTVQAVALLSTTEGGEQLSEVEVVRPTATLKVPLDAACTASPPYVAVIVWVPVPLAGVYVTEQVDVVVLPTCCNVQGLVKVPVPLLPKRTVPLGKVLVGLSVSLTVAVQVVGLPRGTEAGAQLSDVDVVRRFTVTSNVPLLVRWVLSPP
jgi:hypothetical protein